MSGAPIRLAPVLALVLLLCGCGLTIDAEQARVCRLTLPALNPGGSRLTVLRTEPWPEPRSLRIEYRVAVESRPPLSRHVICGFAAQGLSSGKAELVALATERGPVAGATLYLLKRYYVDTPEGQAGDPGPGDPGADLVEIPAQSAYLIQSLLVSLPRTAIYALLASAYALVFGLVGRINLAFGELAAIGGAATVSGVALTLAAGLAAPSLGLGLGLVCAMAASALHGVVGGYFTILRTDGRRPQASLIATIGLSLALMEYLRLAQSPVAVWIPPTWSGAFPLARSGEFIVGVTPMALITATIGFAAGAMLLRCLATTRFGRAWRAYADDPRAATLFGIDGPKLLLKTLALSGALAGLAGALIVAQYGGLGFAGGFQYGLKALIAAILGGIGSASGAFLGGIAIGAFETAWSAVMPIEARDAALYAALVAILILRPGGLLGYEALTPRQV